MRLKVTIIFALLLFSGTIGFYLIESNTKIKELSNDDVEISEVVNLEGTVEQNEVKETTIKENANQNNNTKKEETKTVNEKKTVEPKKEIKQEEKAEVPVIIEEGRKSTPTAWEELGMSEYDYYHKPMWSWARIDYSSRDECVEAGNKLTEQGIGFSCMEVNSYAGTYLGEMLRTF